MTRVGTYKNHKGFDPENVKLMCLATTEQSAERIQTLVRAGTPRDTWELWKSIMPAPMTKPYASWYRIKIGTANEKAAWMEYGTPPHLIPGPVRVAGRLVENVDHPGVKPFHMFQTGASEFELAWAEKIARKNARVFLGARTA